MSRSNAPGCLALVAIPAALALSVAALVYGAAGTGKGARKPPPPPGPGVVEGRAQGLAAEQPPLGEGVAYAELEVLCLKSTGRETERTLLAKRVYGSPRLTLHGSSSDAREVSLPPFSLEGWSSYSNLYESKRSLEGHPAETLAPDWKKHPCDTYGVWMARVLPQQYVIVKDDRAWFGTREELARKAEEARLAFRDRALQLAGLALLAWVFGILAGRSLWKNRHRNPDDRGADAEEPGNARAADS
ncbi:MAG: hypothetical protein KC766_11640 [Myxococcales bacterium]|nr:hypothetical protein [Myxococcales bacterium]